MTYLMYILYKKDDNENMKSVKVANYIRHLARVYGDDELTALKLQKLLYYSYAYYLVFQKEKLFDSKIEKWKHGPVVSDIWHLIDKKEFLKTPPEVDDELTVEQKTIIEDVFKVYGRYAAWTLRCMTHEESPWLSTPTNHQISDEAISKFFVPKKDEFIFEVESLEDVEAIKSAKSDENDLGVDWEDVKKSFNG